MVTCTPTTWSPCSHMASLHRRAPPSKKLLLLKGCWGQWLAKVQPPHGLITGV